MPQGDKSSYSPKQRRKAEHIEEGYEKRGVSKKTAQKRAWATVNKQDGGADGTARKKATVTKKAPAKRAAKKSPAKRATKKAASKRTTSTRSAAAKKAARTRARKR
jgi:plasmid stabilization system protein ParE